MFEGFLFDDFDGIHVEELNMQSSILLPTSYDEIYVWKVEDDYMVVIAQIQVGFNSESKKVLWQKYFRNRLEVSDFNKVMTQFYTIQ